MEFVGEDWGGNEILRGVVSVRHLEMRRRWMEIEVQMDRFAKEAAAVVEASLETRPCDGICLFQTKLDIAEAWSA